jgi:hypothetical protein
VKIVPFSITISRTGDDMIQVGPVNEGGIRLYESKGDRRKAVAQLKKLGYNYFTGYRDTNPKCPHGLSYGKAEWANLIPYEVDV